MGAAVNLGDGEGAALGWAYGARREGYPVDLVLEYCRKNDMMLRANLDVSITPFTELPQLLHFGVVVVEVVLNGQASGIVHADVAAELEEDSASLVR